MGRELVVLGVALSTTVDRQGSAALTQLVTVEVRRENPGPNGILRFESAQPQRRE